MKVSDAPAVVKKLRKTPWRFQQTFKTPLKNLQSFLATIVSTGATQTARITIEQVVFELRKAALSRQRQLAKNLYYTHDPFALITTIIISALRGAEGRLSAGVK
jgi:hypothetical protein